MVNSEEVTAKTADKLLKDSDGILVPGGFGDRGIEGKIIAAQYAREHKIPYLGICLGMQIAVIEYARNVLGYKDANSSELNPDTTHPVIDLMPEQRDVEDLGGTCVLDCIRVRLHRTHLHKRFITVTLFMKDIVTDMNLITSTEMK